MQSALSPSEGHSLALIGPSVQFSNDVFNIPFSSKTSVGTIDISGRAIIRNSRVRFILNGGKIPYLGTYIAGINFNSADIRDLSFDLPSGKGRLYFAPVVLPKQIGTIVTGIPIPTYLRGIRVSRNTLAVLNGLDSVERSGKEPLRAIAHQFNLLPPVQYASAGSQLLPTSTTVDMVRVLNSIGDTDGLNELLAAGTGFSPRDWGARNRLTAPTLMSTSPSFAGGQCHSLGTFQADCIDQSRWTGDATLFDITDAFGERRLVGRLSVTSNDVFVGDRGWSRVDASFLSSAVGNVIKLDGSDVRYALGTEIGQARLSFEQQDSLEIASLSLNAGASLTRHFGAGEAHFAISGRALELRTRESRSIQLSGDTIGASYGSRLGTLRPAAGFAIRVGGLVVSGDVAVSASTYQSDSISETGGPAPLKVAPYRIASAKVISGLAVNYRTSSAGGVTIALSGNISHEDEILNGAERLQAHFLDDPELPFDLYSPMTDEDRWVGGAGLLMSSRAWSARLAYRAEVDSARGTWSRADLNLAYRF